MGIEDIKNNEETIKEQADLFRQSFDEIKVTNPDEALEILNKAIENGLVDPTYEGDHKQNELMHTFADNNEWEKVEEIIRVTVKPDSQKGRISYYEEHSKKKYTGPRVAEKSVEDYSLEEIEKHEVKNYESCMIAIRMEKFTDVEKYIQLSRDKQQIDSVDYLTRELMDKYIKKGDFVNAKRVVVELTDKPGSIAGRKKHIEKLSGISFDEI